MALFTIDTKEKKAIFAVSIYIAYKVLFIALIPMLIGLGPTGGFEVEDIFTKFMFYVGPGIGFILGVIGLLIFSVFYFDTEDSDINGNYIYDPDKSYLPKFFLRPLNLIFIPLILFSVMNLLFAFAGQQTFLETGLPIVEQQFTKTADVFFAIYPASTAENTGLEFTLMLTAVLLGVLWKKREYPKTIYSLLIFPTFIFVGVVYGLINHALRYGFDEYATIGVIIFWGFAGLLNAVFGNFFPGQILHDVNNFSEKIQQLWGSDTVQAISLAVVVGLVLIYIILLTLTRKGKQKQDSALPS